MYVFIYVLFFLFLSTLIYFPQHIYVLPTTFPCLYTFPHH